jgi:hypothetical protein
MLRHRLQKAAFPLTMLLAVVVAFAGPVFAAEEGMKGWGEDSEYNQYYRMPNFDEWKGYVKEVIEIQPLPGMDPGIGLIVEDREGYTVKVHLGPKPFVKPRLRAMNLSPTDLIRFKGAWAYFDGEEVYMASKMSKDEQHKLKTRFTSNGEPFWLLPPDKLAKEEADM